MTNASSSKALQSLLRASDLLPAYDPGSFPNANSRDRNGPRRRKTAHSANS